MSDIANCLERGAASWREGQYGEALAAYEQALAMDPGSVPAWYGKGRTLLVLFDEDSDDGTDFERMEEALNAFERVIELDPGNAAAWNGKGLAWHSSSGRLRPWRLMTRRLWRFMRRL